MDFNGGEYGGGSADGRGGPAVQPAPVIDTPPTKMARDAGSRSMCAQLFGKRVDVAAVIRAQPGGVQQHLSAAACLAEHTGLFNNIFITKEYHVQRKVSLRIYSCFAEQW